MIHFPRVVLGGTFDRLHEGHKAFIRFALEVSDQVILGLTTDEYVRIQKQVLHSLPYVIRKEELESFLKGEGQHNRVTIVPIEKNEIPQVWQDKVDAIVATTDTLKGAETLNTLRKKNGTSPLPIIPFPLVSGKDAKIISSTHIRDGIIDRTGNPYLTEDMQHYVFCLPKNLRSELKKPLGKIISTNDIPFKRDEENICVTVGDVTTEAFLKKNIIPMIGIVDFVIERQRTHSSVKDIGFTGTEHLYHLHNPKSQIRPEVFILISHLFTKAKTSSVLQITGEEDLIVLPVILLAPLGTQVFYGQPKEGMVHVVVSEEIKKNMQDLLNRFEKREAKPYH